MIFKKFGFNSIVLFAVLVLGISSCSSLQTDMVMSTDVLVQNEDVSLLEQKLCSLDAENILSAGKAGENPEFIERCDSLIGQIENAISSTGMNKALLARLYALEGRTCLLRSDKSRARDFYQRSYRESKGDSQTIILASRLGIISDIEDEKIVAGSNENAVLIFERGVQYFENGEYSSAVGRFDLALVSLPEFYKSVYAEVRSKAWELREYSETVRDKKILALLNKDKITVGEMILITQETTALLNQYNGGRKMSEAELYSKLNGAGLFASKSSVDGNEKTIARKNTVLTRFLSARFLWNLFCTRRGNSGKENKYSERYRNKIGKSPIEDLELESEDFDAVLGTVENEIMHLTDGKNFDGKATVTASDYNSWAGKIK